MARRSLPSVTFLDGLTGATGIQPLDGARVVGARSVNVRSPVRGRSSRNVEARERERMLLTRDQIRQDKSFDLLTDAILERDQPRTADLFFRMVARNGRSMSDALSVVTAAEAPFVQVPSHINVRDGQITLVNNDHTILGLRTSMSLVPYVPQEYRLLPMLQSVWYIPAGLDIWNQLLGKYPGRYATMKGMKCRRPATGRRCGTRTSRRSCRK